MEIRDTVDGKIYGKSYNDIISQTARLGCQPIITNNASMTTRYE